MIQEENDDGEPIRPQNEQEDTGSVFSWGWGESGQLGHSRTTDESRPKQILSLTSKRIGFVHCGLSHSMAISDSGDMWLWGKGAYGRLGLGPKELDCCHPTLVNMSKIPTVKRHVRFISGCCGGFHTAAISSKNSLYMFGRGDKGQLGLGLENVPVPTLVPFFKDKKVVKVACGSSHTIVCTNNNELYAFGDNEKGQCGSGLLTTDPIIIPQKIESPFLAGNRVILICCGAHHSLAVVANIDGTRKVLAWGFNDKGQCGVAGKDKVVSKPTEISELDKKDISHIAAGSTHSAAVSLSGSVYTWGNSDHGQLGYGSLGDVLSGEGIARKPRRVKEALFKKRVVEIACGSYHTVALTDKGEIYAFGLGDKGQLGLGLIQNKPEPAIVRGDLQNEYIFKIAAGGRHNLAATNYLPIIKIDKGTLSHDLANFLFSKEFSDIELKIDNCTIFGHKVLLSRSKYLSNLINNMKEGQKTLDLKEEIKSDVFKGIIKYLYTDDILLKIDSSLHDASFNKQKAVSELLKTCHLLQIPLGKTKESLTSTFPKTLSLSLRSLVNNQLFADILFQTEEGEKFYAHKVVLAARAERWKAMFLDGFVESTQSVINITIRGPVFLSLLTYVYTDEVVIEQETAVELLLAANEYGQERLKQLCEDFVEKGIDIENVAWLFEIADQTNSQQLKKFAFYFLLKHFDEVCKTETYMNLSPVSLNQIELHRKPREKTVGEEEGNKCLVQ